MAIKHLINSGCSFAHGYGASPLTDKEYNPIRQKGLDKLSNSKYVGQLGRPIDGGTWVGGYKSAGYLIAKECSLSYIDLARNGNSNEAIFRNLRNFLKDKNKEEYAVLIGWTHAFRREYIGWNTTNEKGEWIQYREIPASGSRFLPEFLRRFSRGMQPSPTMVEFNERPNRPLSFDDHTEYRKYGLIVQTQEMLNNYKIPYVMYNGCGAEHSSTFKEVLELKEMVNKERFYNFETAFDETLKDHPKWRFRDGHPNDRGQTYLSQQLLPIFKKAIESV